MNDTATELRMIAWTLPETGLLTVIDGKPIIVSEDGRHGWTLPSAWRRVIFAAARDHGLSIDHVLDGVRDDMCPEDALLYLVAEALDAIGEQTSVLICDLLDPPHVETCHMALMMATAMN